MKHDNVPEFPGYYVSRWGEYLVEYSLLEEVI